MTEYTSILSSTYLIHVERGNLIDDRLLQVFFFGEYDLAKTR
jgi:hypothetical protein